MWEPTFGVVTGGAVDEILRKSPEFVCKCIKDAYLAHEHGTTENPNSLFLRFKEKPRSRIIGLPAYVGGDYQVSGIKWIASNPDNIERGIPRASAVLILNDYETGYPFACLESSIISATRTSVSAVLGAEYLNGEQRRTEKLGIVGTGLISKYIYRYFRLLGWDIAEVVCHDKNAAEAKRFVDAHVDRDAHSSIEVSESLERVLRESTMISFATSALEPYVTDPNDFRHNPVVLNISLRDLAPEILLAADNVVDDIDHVLNANTSPHLTEQRCHHRAFINGTLAGLIERRFALDENKPHVFSPMGLGVLDIALGKYVYDEAQAANRVIAIDDFFFELQR